MVPHHFLTTFSEDNIDVGFTVIKKNASFHLNQQNIAQIQRSATEFATPLAEYL